MESYRSTDLRTYDYDEHGLLVQANYYRDEYGYINITEAVLVREDDEGLDIDAVYIKEEGQDPQSLRSIIVEHIVSYS